MDPFSKVLIPVDFSERNIVAAHFAIPLAKRFRSEITVLHVGSPHTQEGGEADSEEMKRQVRGFVGNGFDNILGKRVLRFGDPADEIVGYARANHFDLIMMVTRGYGHFRRIFHGSVTAKVLNDADCAVWTGGRITEASPAGWNSPTKILCAVDAGQEGKRVFAWSAKLASTIGAALTLVHVESRFMPEGEDFYSTDSYQKILREAHQNMEQLQQAAMAHAPVIIESGHIPKAICRTAARMEADLIVIGRGSSSLSGRLGMNTYEIVREAECPVISIFANAGTAGLSRIADRKEYQMDQEEVIRRAMPLEEKFEDEPDCVDLASEQSFPASDSPAWIFRDNRQRELPANVPSRRDP